MYTNGVTGPGTVLRRCMMRPSNKMTRDQRDLAKRQRHAAQITPLTDSCGLDEYDDPWLTDM